MRRSATAAILVSILAACGANVTVNQAGGGGAGAQGGEGGQGASGGAGDNFGACDGPAQCVLIPEECCGGCGEMGLDTLAAVASDQVQAYHHALECEAVDCPACEGWVSPQLFAYCDAGQCTGADVRQHALSACTSASDCTLRWGLECCPACGDPGRTPDSYDEIVALRADAAATLSGLVCPANDIGCDECAPQFPNEVSAICVQGHCEVVIVDF